MKVISFLGTASYSTTTYYFGDKEYETRFFPAAVAYFVKPDQLMVCATPTVRKHENLAAIGTALDSLDIAWSVIDIPEGHSETDLWAIFDALTNAVEDGETVIFDVTHSFRSLPILAFLAVAYLKVTRHVRVERVLYGAWEARDELNRSPVFDLTPFVSLLDWLTAAERFERFGDSKDLADLLQKTGTGEKDDAVSRATQALDALSQALRLIRPADALRLSARLPAIMDSAGVTVEGIPAARPYLLLVDDLKQAYSQFAQENPFDPAQHKAGLGKQRDLIAWYVDHQQWVQAISLAREWLISWVMWHLGETDFLNQSLRESIAETMGKEAQRRKEAKAEKRDFRPLFLNSIPNITEALGDWLALAGARNDIDHAGMRKSPREASELIKSIRTLCAKMQKLPLDRRF